MENSKNKLPISLIHSDQQDVPQGHESSVIKMRLQGIRDSESGSSKVSLVNVQLTLW
jgi:hypothetical protein